MYRLASCRCPSCLVEHPQAGQAFCQEVAIAHVVGKCNASWAYCSTNGICSSDILINGHRRDDTSLPRFWVVAECTGNLTHHLKIRNRRIVLYAAPDEPTPFIHWQKLRVVQSRGDPTTYLDGLRIERNGFLVGIRLACFIP